MAQEKWEYKVVDLEKEGDRDMTPAQCMERFAELLNELGNEGWELIVGALGVDGALIFKRKKED